MRSSATPARSRFSSAAVSCALRSDSVPAFRSALLRQRRRVSGAMPRLCETEAKSFVSDEWLARDSPRSLSAFSRNSLV